MLLLFVFPCTCFQVCLNHASPGVQSFLRLFMDTFQGHYKDGTDRQSRDLRYFSGIYFFIRVLFYISIALACQIQSYGYTIIFLIGFTAVVACFKPFKKKFYNYNDVFFLSLMTMLFVCLITFTFSHPFVTQRGLMPLSFVLILVIFIYISALLLFWLKNHRLISWCRYKVRQTFENMTMRLPSRGGYRSLDDP